MLPPCWTNPSFARVFFIDPAAAVPVHPDPWCLGDYRARSFSMINIRTRCSLIVCHAIFVISCFSRPDFLKTFPTVAPNLRQLGCVRLVKNPEILLSGAKYSQIFGRSGRLRWKEVTQLSIICLYLEHAFSHWLPSGYVPFGFNINGWTDAVAKRRSECADV